MNRQTLAGLIAGLLFGAGLGLAGMTDPAVVIGFLDLAGTWNPALAFVMGGAVVVTFIGYRLVLQRGQPVFAPRFQLPGPGAIDLPLAAGAALFGMGWGLTGYCPGPAVASLSAPSTGLAIYLGAMIAGMVAVKVWRGRTPVGRPAEDTQ
jgi:hypothetical protein